MIMRNVLLLVVFLTGVSCDMSNEEDFAVVHGVNSEVEIEKLRAFEWEDIVKRINAGEIDNKIIWVMQTQNIPPQYNETKLKERFIENYQQYLKSLVDESGINTK